MKTRKSRGLLASYSRRRRTEGLGRVQGTGTDANPRRSNGGCITTAATEAAAARARVLSRFGRLKYSMASRSRLGMQISNGESHVSAPGLILYPDSRSSTSPLLSSHFLWRALSIYPSSPSPCRLVSLDGSSFHLNVHQCFSSVTF